MSIQAGLIPSPNFQAEMSAQPLFTVLHFRLSYGTVKVTFEFPFHWLKEKQPQTLDMLDTGIKTVHCSHVSWLFCLKQKDWLRAWLRHVYDLSHKVPLKELEHAEKFIKGVFLEDI